MARLCCLLYEMKELTRDEKMVLWSFYESQRLRLLEEAERIAQVQENLSRLEGFTIMELKEMVALSRKHPFEFAFYPRV